MFFRLIIWHNWFYVRNSYDFQFFDFITSLVLETGVTAFEATMTTVQ